MCLFFGFDIDVEIVVVGFFGTRIRRIGRIYTDFFFENVVDIDAFLERGLNGLDGFTRIC